MQFETKAFIHRPLEDVFDFFRDMHRQPKRENSIVPVYEKITPGQSAWALVSERS